MCSQKYKETKEKIALLDFLAGISLCHELYLIETRSNPTDSSIAASIIIIYDQHQQWIIDVDGGPQN